MKRLFHIDNDPGSTPVQPVLLIQAGSRFCCVAVTDPAASRLFWLSCIGVENGLENSLSELFSTNSALDQAFYEVRVAFHDETGSLQPLRQAGQEAQGTVMQALVGLQPGTETVVEPVPEWQVQAVYAVPGELRDWLRKKFPAARCWHQYAVAVKQLQADADGHLLLNVESDQFTLVAAAGGKLLLAQTYPYSTPEDVLYYLLRTVETFSLSQESVRLSVAGLLDHQSALFRELFQYFRNVAFRNATWDQQGEAYPAHYFTTLNDLALCGS